MRFFLLILLVFISFLSCKKKSSNQVDISKIDISFSVDRFEVDFYKSSADRLSEIKEKYPLLFPVETPDSIWIQKIKDKEEQELFTETQKIYHDFSDIKKELTALFKHIKFYNKDFQAPNVITVLSNIDYENRVIYTGDLLFISLDVYLGNEHRFYSDYPSYISKNNTKNHIIVDVASEIIEKQFPSSEERTFISKIIYEGKKWYVREIYLPDQPEEEKLGYSKEKLDWAIENEEQIWKYFIENGLLYSTDSQLNKRFLEKAPFSKFYLEQDNLSPGNIGGWIGLQIVQSYMKNNDVSLQELLSKSTSEILKKSKYKPKK